MAAKKPKLGPPGDGLGSVEMVVLGCRCRCGHEWIARERERPPRVSEVQERELGQAEEVGVEVRLVTGHRGVYYIGSAPIPLNR